MKKNKQSNEPQINKSVCNELDLYNVEYKLQQEMLNQEIEDALREYESKSGGNGGNRPDAKALITDPISLKKYVILFEFKGYINKLIKLNKDGEIDNVKSNGEANYTNIRDYAVNGAIHYANAILHHTSYEDIFAIGVVGDGEPLKLKYGVYYISKENFGKPQEIANIPDLSFLKNDKFHNFIETIKESSLTPAELQKIKDKREAEIKASLIKLNNDIFKNEGGLSESDRVYLVAATIISTLGVPEKVGKLKKSDLKSSKEKNNKDGDIIMRKIESFFDEKDIPKDKKELIINKLKTTIMSDKLNEPINGETQLKRVFVKIVDDLGFYYQSGLTTDFTGQLFNEMYSWLGFTQDKLNDVVLTPSYIANMLVKLARVNMNSYVWDFATGSAGLLVAAMNEMILDARKKIKSPALLEQKILEIKADQLLGLEILDNIYMLAVLNMILMGDGSSNILNMNSLNFNGNYGFNKKDKKFPANALVLNPPYSAAGNGMIFVQKALGMMNSGYASVIIQDTAGSGKAKEINKEILKNNTLLASIKMPNDIFKGKSNVSTCIYVLRVNEPHNKDNIVQFIDFSYDGYVRTNRKKSTKNLVDKDKAKERYQEIVDIVLYGKQKINLLPKDRYYEGTIDPENGGDWNWKEKVNPIPSIDDFIRNITDYLSWEVSNYLQNEVNKKGK